MTNADSEELSQEKSRLETVIDRLDTAMLLSILAVVIGLIIEYILEFIPGTEPRLLAIAHKVGGGIVTLGVSSELVIEYMHGKRETRLREINESRFWVERTARIKLQQRLSKRTLPDVQRAELVELLKPHAGRRIDVDLLEHHDPEVFEFGTSISEVFRAAGWISSVRANTGLRMHGNAVTIGITKDDGELESIAESVQSVFQKSGIRASIFIGLLAPKGDAPLRVQVGPINVAEEPPI